MTGSPHEHGRTPRRRWRWSYVVVPLLVGFIALIGWMVWETRGLLSAQPNPVHDYYSELMAKMRAQAGDASPAAEAQAKWDRFTALLRDAHDVLEAYQQELDERWKSERYEDRWYGDIPYPVFAYITVDPEIAADIDRELGALERLRESGIDNRLALFAAEAPAFDLMQPQGAIVERDISWFRHVRELVKPRIASMRLALVRNDFSTVAQAFDESLALGQTAGSQAGLMSSLVGIAVQRGALAEIRYELNEAEFSAESCLRLLESLHRRALPPLELALEGERAIFRDMAQWNFTDDGEGNGRLLPESVAAFDALGAMSTRAGAGSAISDGGFIAAFRSRWRLADRRETVAAYDDLIDRLIEASRLAPGARAADLTEEAVALSLPPKFKIVSAMGPVLAQSLAARDRFQMEVEATRVMLALERFRALHGGYPMSLEELAPEILPQPPVDPFTGTSFGYLALDQPDKHGRPYLLYTVGLDGRDDRGVEGADDMMYRERTALDDERASGFDYILNRPRPALEDPEGLSGQRK